MQHDEVIWQVINRNHCSYRAKTQTQNFCRNEYNVTGLCNRSSCPLANSRYATIREHEGVLYLYMKSIERSHTPNKMWERLRLPRNYAKALELVDKYLQHWPKFLVHKNKQRLTKMTQYLIRMRKLALRNNEKLVTMPRKQVKREARREAKAEVAAVLDKNIEKELLSRLQSGTYGDIHNIDPALFKKILDTAEPVVEEEEEEEDVEPQIEYVPDDEVEYEEEDIEDFPGVEENWAEEFDDDEEDDEEGEEDASDEDEQPNKNKRRNTDEVIRAKLAAKRSRRPAVQIEYEDEEAVPMVAY